MRTLRRSRSLAIWGFGKEGQAAFRFISEHYPDLRLTILNDAPLPAYASELAGPVRVVTGDGIADALVSGDIDTIIRSPGVNPYRTEIRAAQAKGIACTTVTNLWFEQNTSASTIAVTGTKGKSTTSGLIHHMLRSAGQQATWLGNVGVPALGEAPGADYTVLELSSYQIADLAYGPDVAVVTNLYPEHTPWHGSVERYYADKLRLLSLDARTTAVCNYEDRELRARVPDHPRMVWFNSPPGWHVQNARLYRRDTPADTSRVPLKGEHNLMNVAAACAVLELLGLDAVAAVAHLEGFRPLPHRLQEIHRQDGILCINDSISTIPEATIAALKAYPDRETLLLLGGTERGQNYTGLYEILAHRRLRGLILLPANGARIARELSGRSMPFEIVQSESLRDAVTEAFTRMTSGDLLLLSPAAPSFGEFENFEERGKAFEELCVGWCARRDSNSGPPA
jgi:UDP-N-acetylmuramoyl-L-alanine---L-glutamate ligase